MVCLTAKMVPMRNLLSAKGPGPHPWGPPFSQAFPGLIHPSPTGPWVRSLGYLDVHGSCMGCDLLEEDLSHPTQPFSLTTHFHRLVA